MKIRKVWKAIYRKADEWVLAECTTCKALNYVEPHGTTAECKRCKADTEHSNLPYSRRDVTGFWLREY